MQSLSAEANLSFMAITDRLDHALQRARAATSEGGARVTDSEARAAVALAREGAPAVRMSDGDIIDAFSRAGGATLLSTLERALEVSAVPRLRTPASGTFSMRIETGSVVQSVRVQVDYIDPHTLVTIRGTADRTALSRIFLKLLQVTYGVASMDDPRLSAMTRHPEFGALQEAFITGNWAGFSRSEVEGGVRLTLSLPTGALVPRAAD